MSQYYGLGDETLWNPSNGVSSLFLRQVRLFEDELGLHSGIGPMQEDQSEVCLSIFEAFVNTLLNWRGRTNHASCRCSPTASSPPAWCWPTVRARVSTGPNRLLIYHGERASTSRQHSWLDPCPADRDLP